jgi:hypothetical protein
MPSSTQNRRELIARRALLTLAGTIAAAPPGSIAAAAPTTARRSRSDPYLELPLWTDGAPEPVPQGLRLEIVERATPAAPLRDRIARTVTAPQVTVVPAVRPDGSAALIVPGGAYRAMAGSRVPMLRCRMRSARCD